MSNHQQPQAGFEWRDQEDEYWFTNNISDINAGVTEEELAACQPIVDNMLAQFDSVFGQSKENN